MDTSRLEFALEPRSNGELRFATSPGKPFDLVGLKIEGPSDLVIEDIRLGSASQFASVGFVAGEMFAGGRIIDLGTSKGAACGLRARSWNGGLVKAEFIIDKHGRKEWSSILPFRTHESPLSFESKETNIDAMAAQRFLERAKETNFVGMLYSRILPNELPMLPGVTVTLVAYPQIGGVIEEILVTDRLCKHLEEGNIELALDVHDVRDDRETKTRVEVIGSRRPYEVDIFGDRLIPCDGACIWACEVAEIRLTCRRPAVVDLPREIACVLDYSKYHSSLKSPRYIETLAKASRGKGAA